MTSRHKPDVEDMRSTTPHFPRISPRCDSPASDYMSSINNLLKTRSSGTRRVSSQQLGARNVTITDMSETGTRQSSKQSVKRNKITDGETVSNPSKGTHSGCAKSNRQSSVRNSEKRVHALYHDSVQMSNSIDVEMTKEKKKKYLSRSARTASSMNSIQLIGKARGNAPCHVQAPTSHSAVFSSRGEESRADESVSLSPYKLSFLETGPNTRSPTPRQSAWEPNRISEEQYGEMKERLLREGKFKEALAKYFQREPTPHLPEETTDGGEDDGYDTDLDTQIGYELIADERAKAVIEDGVFPEYKHNCRTFDSVPNSYFMRHSLDDEIRMRYRYFCKGDCIALSSQIKNHLTVSKMDLKDNAIGHAGMNYFKNVLRHNKHLTELNLACNNIGPTGAEYLRNALVANCFLLKLDVSGNKFGERGAVCIAEMLEENVSLQALVIARNRIGDRGALLIGKALGVNESLKLLDLSWNSIGFQGGVKLAGGLKKNSELEVFRAAGNGFAEQGGMAMVKLLCQNHGIREVDLSANRITDRVAKLMTSSLDKMKGLEALNFAENPVKPKTVFDFLKALLKQNTPIKYVNLEGIDVLDEFKGLAEALNIVQDIHVVLSDPLSKREFTTDALTKNLMLVCELLEDQELEIEDIFPQYDDEDASKQTLNTVEDLLYAIETCGKLSRPDKVQKLKSKLQLNGKQRRFLIGELAVVYHKVICGKDPMREQPLRTHLRRSIKEEREEKARAKTQKAKTYKSAFKFKS